MADLALLILTAAWGTTFLVVKNALAGTSAAVFLLLRFTVAAVTIAAVVLISRRWPKGPSPGHVGPGRPPIRWWARS